MPVQFCVRYHTSYFVQYRTDKFGSHNYRSDVLCGEINDKYKALLYVSNYITLFSTVLWLLYEMGWYE